MSTVPDADRPLAGRTAAVLGPDTDPGAKLARGLADLGATLVTLDADRSAASAASGTAGARSAPAVPAAAGRDSGPGVVDAGSSAPAGDTGAEAGAARGGAAGSGSVGGGDVGSPSVPGGGGGAVDLVVVPVLPAGEGAARRPLLELDAAGWAEACEAPLQAARRGLVAARHALTGGGTIVVVGPIAAITGEAGLVGYSAAGEGARALALSCARAWGADGITVHWLGTVTSLLVGGEPPDRLTLWDEALGRPPTLRGDVAAAVAGLAAPAMRFVTGTSIAVDGGVVLHT